MLVLGLESSCDETAAAVLADGRRVLGQAIASQAEFFAEFGGVVPELAGRNHAAKILPVVKEAMNRAGAAYADLDGIAVTSGPGLTGALLVGLNFGKALALGLNKPYVGVNHLAAHLQVTLLAENSPEPPFVGLLVSGGHTALYEVKQGLADSPELLCFRLLGETIDDAAGEAYDKVGRMLGVPYPAGAILDGWANEFTGKAETFTRPMPKGLDFSFSGLKTAVVRRVKELKGNDNTPLDEQTRHAVAAGFQQAAIETLANKALAACKATGLRSIVIGGGVAANRGLRRLLTKQAEAQGITAFFAPMAFCTDNAVMIAARGYQLLKAGKFDSSDLEASPNMELGVEA